MLSNVATSVAWLIVLSTLIPTAIAVTQDQTTSRANTLYDDADDLQRQLDNEARDRMKYGRPKTIWVFNIPTQLPVSKSINIQVDRLKRLKLDAEVDVNPQDIKHDLKDSDNSTNGVSNNTASAENKTSTTSTADTAEGPVGEEEHTTATAFEPETGWNYMDQHKWTKTFHDCGGHSQSPVNLPTDGLVKARGARPLVFGNYDVMPKTLVVKNEGNMYIIYGEWPPNKRPFIYGGAAHSRRYLFHSLTLHWPSEHSIGTFKYPMETQALHISADYDSFDQAINTTSDMQAFLNVANIYKYSEISQEGLTMILNASLGIKCPDSRAVIPTAPLSSFVPVFKEYASYQGSLSFPPCTESVLWLVRGRTLPVTRQTAESVNKLLNGPEDSQPGQFFIRNIQPMNDRKVFLFR